METIALRVHNTVRPHEINLGSTWFLRLVLDPLIEGLVGLVEGVFQVVVLGMDERFEGDLLGLGGLVAVEEAEGADGFEPHAGVLVVDLLAQQLERLVDPVAPVAEDAGGARRGPWARGRSASA